MNGPFLSALIFACSGTLFVVSTLHERMEELPTDLSGIFGNVQRECATLFPNVTDLNSELMDFPRTCRYRCLDGQRPVTKVRWMDNGWTCGTNRTCLNGSCERISDIEFCGQRLANVIRLIRVDCQMLCTAPTGITYAYNLPNGTDCDSAYNGHCGDGACVASPLPEPSLYDEVIGY